MGKINQGIWGGFSGKVGLVVGCRWKNIYYIRSRAARVSNPNTEKQRCQRGKFRMAVNFMKTILPFVQIGFSNYEQNKSAYNAAISYLMRHAFTGSGANAVLDYDRVRVCQGSLTSAVGASVSLQGGNVKILWTDNGGDGDAADDDTAMVLVYNKTREEAVYNLSSASRASCFCLLRLPMGWEADELAIYLGFRSSDGKRLSNSVCLCNGVLTQQTEDEALQSVFMKNAVRSVQSAMSALSRGHAVSACPILSTARHVS